MEPDRVITGMLLKMTTCDRTPNPRMASPHRRIGVIGRFKRFEPGLESAACLLEVVDGDDIEPRPTGTTIIVYLHEVDPY